MDIQVVEDNLFAPKPSQECIQTLKGSKRLPLSPFLEVPSPQKSTWMCAKPGFRAGGPKENFAML